MKQFDLSGRAAMVTGAGGHLGQALARCLAEAGANVCVTSRDGTTAEKVADKLPHAARHIGLALDYRHESSMAKAVERCVATLGPIRVLVNNGHETTGEDLHSISKREFDESAEFGSGYFTTSRRIRDVAVEHDVDASVVMIGSMYALVGSYPEVYAGLSSANSVGYQFTKGGILQMTRHLSVYWAKDRIRVNCLSPGPFPNPSVSRELVERICDKSPLGRIGTPEELQGPLLLLASDAGSYITGHNLVVDGGWTAW